MQHYWLRQNYTHSAPQQHIQTSLETEQMVSKETYLQIFVMGWAADNQIICDPEFKGSALYDLAHDGHDCSDNKQYDILCIYDYHDLSAESPKTINELTKGYSKICIIAWSFGVWVAEYLLGKDARVISATAINGTPHPVNIEYGIHPKAFMLTVRGLKAGGMDKFIGRMCGSEVLAQKYMSIVQLRDTQMLCDELSLLGEMFSDQDNTDVDFLPMAWSWNKAIIAKEDKIFSTTSQLKYWHKTLSNHNIIEIEGQEHFIWCSL